MGWYYTVGGSRKEIIAELTAEQSRPNGGYFKTIRKCTSGNTLWTVHESKVGDEIQTWIGCYLLANGGNHEGWGYKPMDESMGPYYFTCPLAYLDLAPVVNEEWRKEVLAHWARRKERDAKRREIRRAR